MSQFIYQQKQAWASLSKKPGFIATVVTTMGTTLGALLCILTLSYLLLLKPLPYPEQNRLYKIDHALLDGQDDVKGVAFTYPGLIHLYQNQEVFDTTALIQYSEDVLTSLPNQPTLNAGYVTPEWFSLLGTKLIMGRLFEDTEAMDTHQPVVILSNAVWRDEYDSDPNILDKTAEFSGTSFKIIGVIDDKFIEPQIADTGRNTGVWFPWDYNQDMRLKERWGNISGALTFVGKLKPEYSKAQAEQSLTPLVSDTWIEKVAGIAFFADWKVNIELVSFQTEILGDSEDTVFLLLAGVIGLVLIASTNIANLFMSRTAEQQRQLAIYAALGAKKKQLFKTIFAETGILMALSVLLALVVSAFGFYVLQQHLSSVLPRVDELAINAVTLVSAVLLAIFFALAFAGLSRKMINYRALNSMLQSSGKGTGIQVSSKTRQLLIVSQVAIATVLVFANISLFKEAYSTITETRDYTVNNMAELNLSISAPTPPPLEEVTPVMTQLKAKLEELPQIRSVSSSASVLGGYGIWALTSVADGSNHTPRIKRIDHKFFDFIGQPFVEGDNFSEGDFKDGNRVMIVNDVWAKQLNPTGSAVGMQISPGRSDNFTIIGVVKGMKLPGQTEIPPRVYTPASVASTQFTLLIEENQKVSREQIVEVISEVSSLYALFGLERLTEVEKQQLFTQYATATTTAVLAFLTLFLAGVGLYGILSYGTQMRRFELGTRMAIGAKRHHLIGLIVKDNSRVIVVGMLVSLLIILGLYLGYSDTLDAYLNANLIGMFVLTILAIGALSLFACYWPLRQFINQPAVHSLRGSD